MQSLMNKSSHKSDIPTDMDANIEVKFSGL